MCASLLELDFVSFLFGECTFITRLWVGFVNFEILFWEYTPVRYFTHVSAYSDIYIKVLPISLKFLNLYKDPLSGRSHGATPRNGMELCYRNRGCYKKSLESWLNQSFFLLTKSPIVKLLLYE
jgi:hypothetical protein